MVKILVVEDEENVRTNVTDLLDSSGYQVLVASNGREALKILETITPDLILSDIMMPEVDGYQLMEEISKRAEAIIPFIFMSAKSDVKEIRKGMSYGAEDYITKPFKAKDILDTIQLRLSKRNKIEKSLENLKLDISMTLPHELRTPLVSILGYTDLLIDDFPAYERREVIEMLTKIKQSGKRLHNLIEKFILYSHYSLKEIELTVPGEMFSSLYNNFKELVDKVISKNNVYINRSNDMLIDINAEPPEMVAEHISFIFTELLDNAVKFSQPTSSINISTFAYNNYFVLSVQDSGRGMNKEDIKKLSPFIQIGKKMYQQTGTGLGLSIVNKIVELYHGKIIYDCEKNSFFRVDVCIPFQSLV